MRLNASDKAGSYKYDLKKLHSNRSALVSIIYCELICTTLILVYALLTSTIPGANPGSKCPFWREENQWQQLVCHRRFLLALSRFIVEFHPSESTSHASNHNFLSVTQNEYDCVKFNYSSTSRNGPSGVVLPGFSWRWWWRELLSHHRLFPTFMLPLPPSAPSLSLLCLFVRCFMCWEITESWCCAFWVISEECWWWLLDVKKKNLLLTCLTL